LIPHPPLYYVLAALAGAPWPEQAATAAAQASVNAYFDKSLALRQSVTLPALMPQELAPAWSARFVSLLGGLVVLLCTWWTARRLVPAAPTFALAAAAIAAFNPQFLFTAVTITNDGWSAATAALALAAGVDVVMARRGPRSWLWVGAATGLAALTKYSTLAIALPLGSLWLLYTFSTPSSGRVRRALAALGWAAAGFALVGGWWFVRNWLLYGELVPLDRMAEVLPTMRRAEPYTWARTFEHIPWLVASFWGVFVAIIAPPLYLDATRWFMLIGFGGLLLGLLAASVQWWQTEGRRIEVHSSLAALIVYLVLLPWLGAVIAMVLYWTRTVEYGEQGRLAHVGASAFGVVMAWGWGSWLLAARLLAARWLALRRWQAALYGVLAVASAVTALALLPFLQASYALPPAVVPAPDRPLDVTFGPGVRLLGADFPAGAALAPGQPLPVTLYFTTAAPIPEDYTLFLHVADAEDRLLYQFDGVPAQGHHPTRQWRPGEVFADTHTILVDEIAADELATLSVGFYPIADANARLAVTGPDGAVLGDRLVLAPLRLHAAADAAPSSPPRPETEANKVWQNGVVLAAADVITGGEGLPAGVALTWLPTATVHADYTVFVQVLDGDNRILAQVDRQPQAAKYPTSTWRAGDVITDTMAWSEGVEGWAQIILGLYGADGSRLPLTTGGDYVQIARR
jgi:hypothetical protein